MGVCKRLLLQQRKPRDLARLGQPCEEIHHAVAVLQRDDTPAVDRKARWEVVLIGEASTRRVVLQLRYLTLHLTIQLELEMAGFTGGREAHCIAVAVLVLHGCSVADHIKVEVFPRLSRPGASRPWPLDGKTPPSRRRERPASLGSVPAEAAVRARPRRRL